MFRHSKRKILAAIICSALFSGMASQTQAAETDKEYVLCQEDEVVMAFMGDRYSLLFDSSGQFKSVVYGFSDNYYYPAKVYKKDALDIDWATRDETKRIYQISSGKTIRTVPRASDVELYDSFFSVINEERTIVELYNNAGELLYSYDASIIGQEAFVGLLTDQDTAICCLGNGTAVKIPVKEPSIVMEAELPVLDYIDNIYDVRYINGYFYFREQDDSSVSWVIRNEEGDFIERVNYINEHETVKIEDDEAIVFDYNLQELQRIAYDGSIYYGNETNYKTETYGKPFYKEIAYDELNGHTCDRFIQYATSVVSEGLVPAAETDTEYIVYVDGETRSIPRQEGEYLIGFNEAYEFFSFTNENDENMMRIQNVNTGEDRIVPKTNFEMTKNSILIRCQEPDKTMVLGPYGEILYQTENDYIRLWKDDIMIVRRGIYYGFTDLNGNWIGRTVSPFSIINQ